MTIHCITLAMPSHQPHCKHTFECLATTTSKTPSSSQGLQNRKLPNTTGKRLVIYSVIIPWLLHRQHKKKIIRNNGCQTCIPSFLLISNGLLTTHFYPFLMESTFLVSIIIITTTLSCCHRILNCAYLGFLQ